MSTGPKPDVIWASTIGYLHLLHAINKDTEHPVHPRSMIRVFVFHCIHTFHVQNFTGPEVVKLEFILKLKIKRNDWPLADTCPEVAHHCALF